MKEASPLLALGGAAPAACSCRCRCGRGAAAAGAGAASGEEGRGGPCSCCCCCCCCCCRCCRELGRGASFDCEPHCTRSTRPHTTCTGAAAAGSAAALPSSITWAKQLRAGCPQKQFGGPPCPRAYLAVELGAHPLRGSPVFKLREAIAHPCSFFFFSPSAAGSRVQRLARWQPASGLPGLWTTRVPSALSPVSATSAASSSLSTLAERLPKNRVCILDQCAMLSGGRWHLSCSVNSARSAELRSGTGAPVGGANCGRSLAVVWYDWQGKPAAPAAPGLVEAADLSGTNRSRSAQQGRRKAQGTVDRHFLTFSRR